MAHINKVEKNLAGNSADNFTTPTLEELPIEYQQIYESLEKKREADFQREEEDFQEFIKLFPPSNNHVGPSVMLGRDKKGNSARKSARED